MVKSKLKAKTAIALGVLSPVGALALALPTHAQYVADAEVAALAASGAEAMQGEAASILGEYFVPVIIATAGFVALGFIVRWIRRVAR